ncbi:MAG: FAD:protein FMN transferase [Candidatus Heteroscillospira sp.]|jgi:thiamine biosynthesis lipoprotein
MNKLKKLLLLLIPALLLCGCSALEKEPELDEYTSYVYAMDTVMTLTAYSDSEDANSALADAAGAIEALERRVSVTDEQSDIFRLNANSDAPQTVSDDTAEILTRALELCRSTGGALDVSIYPVVREWGFTTGNYKVPDYNTLLELLKKVDYSNVSVDGNTVSLSPGMQIDLGSVTKGYVGDMAADILSEAGIRSAVLNLGGNVRVMGSNPNGESWRVGVQDPLDSSKYFGIISVTDKSVVTSGGYNRYFESGGKTYWHILDPHTGYPADNGVISATIVGEDGLMCDGLSTAAFVMGVNEAFDYWRQNGGFDMLLMTKYGHIYITPGLEDCFELMPSYAADYTIEVVH